MLYRWLWRLPFLVLVVAATALAVRTPAAGVRAADAAPGAASVANPTSLVGAWRGTLLAEPGEDFVNFNFQVDKTVLVSLQHGANPVFVQTTGAWSQTGDHQFAATLPFPYHDAAGVLTGTVTIQAQITLSTAGDTFTTLVSVTTTDATGAVLGSYVGAPWVLAARAGG